MNDSNVKIGTLNKSTGNSAPDNEESGVAASEDYAAEKSEFDLMLQERELFKAWNEVKTDINEKNIVRNVKEGEIYWCSVGKNVGVEINGKHETFSRPVVILKKLSRFGFMGVPLTSQEHVGNWYASFEFKDRTEYAVLAQARVFSVSRLGKRMGMLPESDLSVIKEAFRKLYF